MQQNSTNLTIIEGTISFWIKENKIRFTDNQNTPIFSSNPTGGSIFIMKDSDNKLQVSYFVTGKGRVDLEFDVSSINPLKKHLVAFTWSLEKKELKLFFDGKIVAEKEVSFLEIKNPTNLLSRRTRPRKILANESYSFTDSHTPKF